MLRRANPDEETLDWRAVCGRTARTVRREGRAIALPYPYQHAEVWRFAIRLWWIAWARHAGFPLRSNPAHDVIRAELDLRAVA